MRKKTDGFTWFLIFFVILILFFFLRILLGFHEEKKEYTVLLPLGDFSYDADFLKQVAKIKGIQEIWPVVEVPITLFIDDYSKTTVFSGVDLNAFTEVSRSEDFGNTPLLLLGQNALADMKDSNGHTISQKQQEKYLKMEEALAITYQIDTEEGSENLYANEASVTEGNPSRNAGLPCKTAAILQENSTQIYIPISQARNLCQEAGMEMKVTKILLKINGKENLKKAEQLFNTP